MFCPNCANPIETGVLFCDKCGAKQITENPPVNIPEANNTDKLPPDNNLSLDKIIGNRSLIPTSFALAIIFFFFTFFNFKCGDYKIAGGVSGINLVTGTTLKSEINLERNNKIETHEIPANIWAILAFASTVIGLGVYLFKSKREAFVGTGTGLIGATSLIILQFVIKSRLLEKTEGRIEVDLLFAYWGALIALCIAGILSYLQLQKTGNWFAANKKLMIFFVIGFIIILVPYWLYQNAHEVLKYDDGKYIGHVRDGKPNGYGIFSYNNGNQFEGEFLDGIPDGQGTYKYANGSKYVGEYKNGQRNGQGFYTYSNEDWIKGEWKDDVIYTGQGMLSHVEGEPIQNEWRSGNLYNGYGTINYSDGAKYVGKVKNGQRNGQGTLTLKTTNNQYRSDQYIGEWKDDILNGQGTCFFATGNKYVGELKNGQKSGQGIMTWWNGQRYEGEWRDDKRNGQGILTWDNDKKYVGEFKDDNFNGHGTMTWDYGRRQNVGGFKNGEFVGVGQ